MIVKRLLKSARPTLEISTSSTRIRPLVGSTKRKNDRARVLLPEPVLPKTPTFSPGRISKLRLCRTSGRSGYSEPSSALNCTMFHKKRTAYRITRFSHLISPFDGQLAGGLGSIISGGSRGTSVNSLIRSTATWSQNVEKSTLHVDGYNENIPSIARDQRIGGP